MAKKVALCTGISGQDGSFLTTLLLKKGYEVWGTLKRNSVADAQVSRLKENYKRVKLVYADLNDLSSLINVMKQSKPTEIYNLAAQSHVGISFIQPIYTVQTNAIGTLNVLEAMRLIVPDAKMYQASSSEMFGNNVENDGYQRETTLMNPVSPYGASKLFGYNITRNYRQSYGLFVSNGILFNHESPLRGTNFVTNKVAKGAVEIKLSMRKNLHLGNLDAKRDWGHAKDYCNAMWLILQRPHPDDFVCATGKSHSVRELCDYVFSYLAMDYNKFIISDEKYLRPEELYELRGDSTKLKRATGWEPKISFENILNEMIEYWLNYYKENKKRYDENFDN